MDCFSRVLSLFSAPDVADICLPIFGLRAVLGVGASVGQCDRQLYTEVSVMFPGRYRGARLAHSGDLSLHTDYRPPSLAATSTRALHHHQHQT